MRVKYIENGIAVIRSVTSAKFDGKHTITLDDNEFTVGHDGEHIFNLLLTYGYADFTKHKKL